MVKNDTEGFLEKTHDHCLWIGTQQFDISLYFTESSINF